MFLITYEQIQSFTYRVHFENSAGTPRFLWFQIVVRLNLGNAGKLVGQDFQEFSYGYQRKIFFVFMFP